MASVSQFTPFLARLGVSLVGVTNKRISVRGSECFQMVRLTLLLVSSKEESSLPWDAESPKQRALFLHYAEQTPRWLSGGPALRGHLIG